MPLCMGPGPADLPFAVGATVADHLMPKLPGLSHELRAVAVQL